MRNTKILLGAGLIAALAVSGGCSSSGGGGAATPPVSAVSSGSSIAGAVSSPTAGSDTITVDGIKFPKPEKTSLKMGLSAIDVGLMPTYLMPDIAKKFGITINTTALDGAAPVAQSLIAGQIDMSEGAPGVAFDTAKAHQPAQMVYVGSDVPTDILFTAKDVSTPAELKGKSIAVSTIGAYAYGEVLLALKSMGLTTKDVTITQVGNDSARLAALKSGSVAASIQDATVKGELTSEGFHALVDLGKLSQSGSSTGPIPGFISTTLLIPESFQKKYPNTTLDLVAIHEMGEAEFHVSNTVQQNAEVWAKVSGESMSEATSDIKQELALLWRPKNGECSIPAIQFSKQVLESADSTLSKVNAAAVCNNSYVQKLQSMGLPTALKLPTTR